MTERTSTPRINTDSKRKTGSVRDSSFSGSKRCFYQKQIWVGGKERDPSGTLHLHDRKDVYTKNKYGLEEKTGSLRKNSSGGFDIYKKNKYGLEEKVGAVKSK